MKNEDTKALPVPSQIYSDERGYHSKFFWLSVFTQRNFGEVKEIFMTSNHLGTMRGLHKQTPAQQKIIKPVNGRFNVVIIGPENPALDEIIKLVDESFPRYVGWNKLTFSDCQNDSFYGKFTVYSFFKVDEYFPPMFVPAGSLCGYLAREEGSKMLYIADENFNGAGDTGFYPLSFGDQNADIWGVNMLPEGVKPILSAKDIELPKLVATPNR